MSSPVTALRRHGPRLLALGLPISGSYIAQIAIALTDSLMLGWYGVDELAAVTLASTYAFVFFIMGSGFAFALPPMVASAVAQGDETQARRVTRMGLWLSALFGAGIMPLLIWSEPILLALGQQPEIAGLASHYLAIFSISMIPSLVVVVLRNFLAALERTTAAFWITVGAAILNAALNYALIFGNFGMPELGLTGAAIASVSMHIASMLVLMVYCQIVAPEHALFVRFWRPDWEAFGRVFRLGWPIGLTNLAESGLFSASALMMGWIGATTLAAHGIAVHLSALAFVLHLGLAQGATVRVGHAFGMGNRADVAANAWASILTSGAIAALAVTIFLVFPEPLIGAFLDPDEPARAEIVALGVTLLALAALFQTVDAGQVIALSLLRGLHDTKVPMIYASLSYWVVGLGTSYVLGFVVGLGAVGVWLGLVVGLGTAATLLMWRFWRGLLPGIGPGDTARA